MTAITIQGIGDKLKQVLYNVPKYYSLIVYLHIHSSMNIQDISDF